MGIRKGDSGWVSDDVMQNVGNSGAAVTIDHKADTVIATLSANCTFTLPAAVKGKRIDLVLTQGTGGSKTATFTGAKAAGGAVGALSTAAGAVDVLSARCYDGSTWVVNLDRKGVA